MVIEKSAVEAAATETAALGPVAVPISTFLVPMPLALGSSPTIN
jgi:hypothetical protein